MSFTAFPLHHQLQANLQACGYTVPTPIQEAAIGPVIDGRDLLGLAQTGTGKTAAFVLPILQRLLDRKGKPTPGPRALIISPTRELAEQTNDYINKLAVRTGLRSAVFYGGVGKAGQIARIRSGIDSVVACPGRLLDLVQEGALSLANIRTLVLDEADHMFDRGFLPDIRRIIKLLPKQRQNLVFSATMPTEIRALVEATLSTPVTVQIDHTKAIATISHVFMRVAQQDKVALLRDLLNTEAVRSAIVFTRTKHKAKNLARQLETSGLRATSLQGNLSQQKRQQALNGFKDGSYTILVATDIASRGIDVSEISHIINFDMPETAETYTHRTGRTGRAQHNGEAISFIAEDNRPLAARLERSLGAHLSYRHHSYETAATKPAGSAEQTPRQAKRSQKNTPRQRGKSASRRSRAASFDFGV